MRQLTRALDARYRTPDTVPVRRLAVVSSVDVSTGLATVTIGGDTTTAAVPYLTGYLPVAGDSAVLDTVAGAPVLIGTTAGQRFGCRLRRAATQAIGSGSPAAISWDTEDEDTDGYIAVTATTITIPAGLGGLYDVTAWANHQSVEATYHSNRNYLDIGVTAAATGIPASFRQKIDSVEDQATVTATNLPLAPGDTVVARIFQDTGSNQNCVGAWISCYRTGP